MHVDFEQIKRTTDIVRVIESHGVALKKVGKDHVGLCPFHDDHNPSLRVTASKGLFRCPVCQATGNVIQFVAKKTGVSERDAAIQLMGTTPGVKLGSEIAPPPPKVPTPPTVQHSAALLQRVVQFYTKTLHKDRAGLDYLKGRKLDEPTLLEVFQVGYSNGTLPGILPKEGELRDGLKALGVLNARGQEHFFGCVTVPIHDGQGNVCGIYGRRVESAAGDLPRHLYLPGPHRGVFNARAAKTSPTLFLCEAILDALALWRAGFKNVISLYGADAWTPEHAALLRENQITEVFLCLDQDEAGQRGTAKLRDTVLPALVKTIHVIAWPEGVKDAADFFLTRSPQDFEALLKPPSASGETPAVPQSENKSDRENITATPDGITVVYGARRYELRAIEQPTPARLRATVRAVGEQGRFHIDTVDFYLSRSRRLFISEAARLFRETAETIESDVHRLLPHVEARAADKTPHPAVAVLSEDEKAQGQRFGQQPDLAGEIVRDLERLGMVGEELNKLTGYLVMTSRKLDDPLAMLILSGSGAGKSHLQDAILSLCPPEELIKLTSLTDRALFYKGEDSLKHKVLAVEELAGAEGADYAIRNLISAKKLAIESTMKNPLTGKLETQINTVHGPTAVFQTTTQPRTDAETRSRFILVSVDESLEQTRAILQSQRQSHTLEGLRQRRQREAICQRHHAFQRALQPVIVLNPFEPRLTYAEDRLAVRRDHPKYLNLILAVTFLHQCQRAVRHDPDSGVDFIETTLEDIALANKLARELFGQCLEELSRPGLRLLRLIFDHVQAQVKTSGLPAPQIHFTRRELRETFKWSEYQLRTYLDELAELEYVLPLAGRQGQPFRYRLLYDGQGESGERFLSGLKSVEQLRQETGPGAATSRAAGELRGVFGNFEGASLNGSHEVKSTETPENPGVFATTAPASSASPETALAKNTEPPPRVEVTEGGSPA